MPDFSHLRLKRRIAFSKDSSSFTWTRGTNVPPLLSGLEPIHDLTHGTESCQLKCLGRKDLASFPRPERASLLSGLAPKRRRRSTPSAILFLGSRRRKGAVRKPRRFGPPGPNPDRKVTYPV